MISPPNPIEAVEFKYARKVAVDELGLGLITWSREALAHTAERRDLAYEVIE
jgi:hypothetical protein